MPLRCDIFCTAIDNYGDIGVCWRLARQLAGEHGCEVTLWLDDLAAMAHMRAGIDPALDTQPLPVTGSGALITLRRWRPEHDDAADTRPSPGDLIIEGFACRLPDAFLQAMAARPVPPRWINLEYLSAEAWVAGCHGLSSTHPRTGQRQQFWFPGFTPATGGLLRERDLLTARDAFQASATAQQAFWTTLGLPDALAFHRRISLFAYENPAVSGLLQALADDTQDTLLLVPAGRVLADIAAWAGATALSPGDRLRRGNLTLVVLPFLGHADYDRLLWACDANAVRGEDSFVRAQWAGRPLLWHIYQQDEAAHEIKLTAWLDTVMADQPGMPAIWREQSLHWNQVHGAGMDWPRWLAELPAMTLAARRWSTHLAGQPDLAMALLAASAGT